MNQKGAIALVAPIILLLIVGAVVFFLVSKGLIKSPLSSIKLPGLSKEPTVSLQTGYKNPFDKSAQYVNPFSGYKNPFDSI
ncbi:hypothetical protein HYU45_03850 [Candidatus Daviesbacteria bacterium]|nr:hypothetical protein [Candidatus Daviesbacteria bacterium]